MVVVTKVLTATLRVGDTVRAAEDITGVAETALGARSYGTGVGDGRGVAGGLAGASTELIVGVRGAGKSWGEKRRK